MTTRAPRPPASADPGKKMKPRLPKPRSTKREPLQERAKKTYNSILDCVERIILTKSIDKLTPRAVVLETGITQGALYRYFADVIEMRDALFERYMAEFHELVSSSFEKAKLSDAAAAMELLFELVLDFNRRRPAMLRLSLDPTTHSRAHAVEQRRQSIASIIAETMRVKGIIADYDRATLEEIYLCVMVSASLTKAALLRAPDGDPLTIEAARRIIRRQAAAFDHARTGPAAAAPPRAKEDTAG
jgi:AcrR family transcriptional regulator